MGLSLNQFQAIEAAVESVGKPTTASRLISTTEGRIYLIALDSLERVEIQYVPKELVFTRNAKLGELAIVGRNVPRNHQTGGSKFVKLQLDFYSVEASRQDVLDKIRLIESWTYNEGNLRNPDKVKLVFGKLFRDEVWTVQNVDVRVNNFAKKTFLPQQAYVDLTLKLDPDSNIKRSDVK